MNINGSEFQLVGPNIWKAVYRGNIIVVFDNDDDDDGEIWEIIVNHMGVKHIAQMEKDGVELEEILDIALEFSNQVSDDPKTGSAAKVG